MFKKSLLILFLSIFLVSCGNSSEENCERNEETGECIVEIPAKKEFVIDVVNYNDLGNKTSIKKTSTINSAGEVDVTTNIGGKISSISVKEGDRVSAGQLLSTLSDTTGNMGFSVERARNTLERAKISYNSTEIDLNSQITNIQINIKNLEENLEAAKKSLEIANKSLEADLSQIETSTTSINLDTERTKSQLEIDKLNASIDKMKFDYENTLKSNLETLEGFKNTIAREKTNLDTILRDVIDFSDTLLGITDKNARENINFYRYLGLKKDGSREKAKNSLQSLMEHRNNVFDNLNFDDLDVTNKNFGEKFNGKVSDLSLTYKELNDHLNDLEDMINNTAVSLGAISETDIAGYKGRIDGYQSQVVGNLSGIVSIKNSTTSFVNTYKGSEESVLKQIELAKRDIEIIERDRDLALRGLETQTTSTNINTDKINIAAENNIISLENNIASIQNNIASAKNSLVTINSSKPVTLSSLNNAIKDAEIALNQAQSEFNKLRITAPISGVIKNVVYNNGQEVGMGSNLFTIRASSESEIQMGFSKEELEYIKNGMTVDVVVDNNQTYKGTVTNISNESDASLNYLVTIKLNQNNQILGSIASVTIPLNLQNKLINVGNIEIISSDKAAIYVLKDGKTERKVINIGRNWGNQIEIVKGEKENFDNLVIVTTKLTNYIPEDFELVVRGEDKKEEKIEETNKENV